MTNKNPLRRIFWLYQVSGWILFSTIYIIFYGRQYLESFREFSGIIITYSIGFVLSLILRRFYWWVSSKNFSAIRVLLLILFSDLICAALWQGIDVTATYFIFGFKGNPIGVMTILEVLLVNTAILFGWSTLYFALKLWYDWINERNRVAKTTKLLKQARLQMLRYQLNPHFLFNALNSIRTLVDENQEVAKQVITELAEFLRYSLINRDQTFVPLHEELEAARHYLAIQKIRYENNLELDIDVDPETDSFPILSFLIHPLMENAVKYGMKTSEMPLKIGVSAKMKNSKLELEIKNSGKWIEPSNNNPGKEQTNTGVENVRLRLENVYGDRFKFDIDNENNMVLCKLVLNQPPETM